VNSSASAGESELITLGRLVTDPAEPALDCYVLDTLADGADALASMDVLANGFQQPLGEAAHWLHSHPRITEAEWATLRGQLLGLQTNANVEAVGKYAIAFIGALGDQAPMPFLW
jgi:hypothetical protein